jgi:hypothetical protein
VKTIFMLWHKKNLYGDNWEMVRAFEAQAEADDLAVILKKYGGGECKVEASILVPAADFRPREIDTQPRASLP